MNKKDKGFSFFQQRNSEKKLIPFATKYLKPNLLKIEIFLVIINGLFFYLKLNDLLTVGLLVLSTVYYFMGFAEFENYNKTNKKFLFFYEYIANWGRAIAVVGILFVVLNWPGGDLQLRIGLITVFACLLINTYFILKNNEDEVFSLNEFFRSLIILIISFLIYYFNVGLS